MLLQKLAERNLIPPLSVRVSAFNYAKLAAELNKNNVAINSINFFIKTYPESTYTDEAKSLLADVFLNTKNYKAAIKLLEDIPNLNVRSKEAYQKITFHRAEELYLNQEYDRADAYFKKSLKYPDQ
jgi:TolA-binding protein